MKITDDRIKKELQCGNVVRRRVWNRYTCMYIWKHGGWLDVVEYLSPCELKTHDLTIDDIVANDWETVGVTNLEFSMGDRGE